MLHKNFNKFKKPTIFFKTHKTQTQINQMKIHQLNQAINNNFQGM
jgi:hypothetical protein